MQSIKLVNCSMLFLKSTEEDFVNINTNEERAKLEAMLAELPFGQRESVKKIKEFIEYQIDGRLHCFGEIAVGLVYFDLLDKK